MATSRFDEIFDTLRDEYDVPDDVIEKLSASSLRKQLAEAQKEAAEAPKAIEKLGKFETAPQRREAFKKVGVDYDSLPKFAKAQIDAFDQFEDAEAVANYVREMEFPVSNSPTPAEPTPGQEFVQNVTAPTGTPNPTDYDAAIANAKSVEEITAIVKQFHGAEAVGDAQAGTSY